MEILNQLILMSLETNNRVNKIEQQISEIQKQKGLNRFEGHPDQFFGGTTYAQHGDDLIIMCIFRNIGIDKPSYLDIGAHHPFNISNTALLYQTGCRGVNVEANPNLYEEFLKHRPEDKNLNIGVAPTEGTMNFYMIDEYSGRNTFDKDIAEAFVRENPQFSIQKTINLNVTTIDKLVFQHCGGVYPDLLSIDVEGLDKDIIMGADFRNSKPKVICIEIANAGGSKDSKDIRAFLEKNGYFLSFKAISNAIFVLEDYKDALLG